MNYQYTTESRTMLADLYTPVGVYMRMRDLCAQSMLLESSDYHEASNSRSFIGINPIGCVAIGHGKAVCHMPDGSTMESEVNVGHPTEQVINDFLSRISITGSRADVCGLYGYTSFNAVRYFENIPVKDCTMEKNDAPDMMYILYKDIIVFDHYNNQLTLVTLNSDSDSKAAQQHLDELAKQMNKNTVHDYGFHAVGNTTSPLTDEQHKANIRKGIAH